MKKRKERFKKTLDKIFKSVIINLEVDKNLFRGTDPINATSKTNYKFYK